MFHFALLFCRQQTGYRSMRSIIIDQALGEEYKPIGLNMILN